MPRFTLRKSGEKRLSLAVKFNISRESLEAMIAEQIINVEPVPRSRSTILKLARLAAFTHGFKLQVQCEEDVAVGNARERGARKEAARIVDAVFPELKG